MKKGTQRKRPRELQLDGSLTIQRAAELKDILSKAIGESGDLLITFAEVHDVDLSFLQLLRSVQAGLSDTGKSVVVDSESCQALREVAHEAGFSDHVLQFQASHV